MNAVKYAAFLGACLALLGVFGLPAQASGGHVAGLVKAEIDLGDTASLQRGAQIFVDRCLSCHSANLMRYNRIGLDLGMSEDEVPAASREEAEEELEEAAAVPEELAARIAALPADFTGDVLVVAGDVPPLDAATAVIRSSL